jgi:acetylglutamate synthase
VKKLDDNVNEIGYEMRRVRTELTENADELEERQRDSVEVIHREAVKEKSETELQFERVNSRIRTLERRVTGGISADRRTELPTAQGPGSTAGHPPPHSTPPLPVW